MSFGIDLPGRVGNIRLSKSDCLQPLFEAVVNSIQEIGEVKRKQRASSKGRVFVTIERSSEQIFMKEGGLPFSNRPISGFTIEDDGIGFTEENFKSFQKSDTTRKIRKGGKGVGRFLWLKAFDGVKIQSSFQEGGQWKYREFDFLCTEDGIENAIIDTTDERSRRTVVRLLPEIFSRDIEASHRTLHAIFRARRLPADNSS
jgi:hypothetical protein